MECPEQYELHAKPIHSGKQHMQKLRAVGHCMQAAMKRFLTHYTPPGMHMRGEFAFFIIGTLLAFLYALGYLVRFADAKDALYRYPYGGRKILDPSAVMPDFERVFDCAWAGFFIVALCMTGYILYHYLYFYQNTKSIYLMRRLEQRWELHRRCLTAPLIGIGLSLAFAALCFVFAYLIYRYATPAVCLPEHAGMSLRGLLFGVGEI